MGSSPVDKTDIVLAQVVGQSHRSRWYVVAAVPLVAAGLATLYVVDPAGSSLYPSCPFHALTGLHCPGCGTLRGIHQLLGGHPIAALDLNPLTVLSLPFLAYALLSELSARAMMITRPSLPAGQPGALQSMHQAIPQARLP